MTNHVDDLKDAARTLEQTKCPDRAKRCAIAEFLRDLARAAEEHQTELANAIRQAASMREFAHQLSKQLHAQDEAGWSRYQQAETAAAADRRAALDERIALLGALDHERAKVCEQRDQILAFTLDLQRSAEYATTCRSNLAYAMGQLAQARNEADAQQLDALQGPDDAEAIQ
jgi:hypothetical protein